MHSTRTSQETKEPTPTSKQVLRSASIAFARKTVDATFQGSVLVPDETIPRFSLQELQLGEFLGKGAFGTVSEIKAFDALGRRNKRRQLIKVDTPQVEESELTETDRVQRESRQFLSQNCCRKTTGDARYAVKKLRANVTKDPGLFLKAITDMAVETRILTNLHHPNIIKLRAVASCDCYSEDYFLVLDRLYDTLAQRIQKWACLQGRGKGLLRKLSDRKGNKVAALYEERVHAAYDLAAALDYMHLQNIVYRDIKPENIGFDIRDDVKLFDMGLAKELKPENRNPDGTYNLTSMTGSLSYMAPEVANGEPYNELCDSHSFAILWWEMLALSKAFDGYTPNLIRKKVHSNEFHRPMVQASWEPAIQMMLRKSWAFRWQERYSMSEIKQELRKEYVRATGGDETSLGHLRRRSTNVFECVDEQ